MRVKAAPGLQVPHEFDPRTYINDTDEDAVEMPQTPYYIRRLAAGELVDAEPVAKAVKASAKGGAQ
jgi:hypothetical protein